MTTSPAVAVLIPVVIGMPEGQPVEVLKALVGVHPVTEATETVVAAVLKVTVIVPPASAAGEVLKPTVQFEDAETKLLPGTMVTAETEEAPALTTSSPRLIVTSAKKASANRPIRSRDTRYDPRRRRTQLISCSPIPAVESPDNSP